MIDQGWVRVACAFVGPLVSPEVLAQIPDVPPVEVHVSSHVAWLDVSKDGCEATGIARLELPLAPLSLTVGDAYSVVVSGVSGPVKALDWFGVWNWEEKRGRDGKQPRREESSARSLVRPGETYKIFLLSDAFSGPVELKSGTVTYVVEKPATIAIKVSASPFQKPDNPRPRTRNLIGSVSQNPEFCATVAQANIRIATLTLRVVRRPK